MRKDLITSLIFCSTLLGSAIVSADNVKPINQEALQNMHLYFVDGRVPIALQERLREEQFEIKGPSEDTILISFFTNWYRDSEVYAYFKLCESYAGEEVGNCYWRVWHAKLPREAYSNWRSQNIDFERSAKDLTARGLDIDSLEELENYMPIDGITDPLEMFKNQASVRSISSKNCADVMQGLEKLKILGEPTISVPIGSLIEPPKDEIVMHLHATHVEIEIDLFAAEGNSSAELKLNGTKGHSRAGEYASMLLDPLEKCRWESE